MTVRPSWILTETWGPSCTLFEIVYCVYVKDAIVFGTKISFDIDLMRAKWHSKAPSVT